MKYQFGPHAQQELENATGYYHQISPTLGHLFVFEVEQALMRIMQFPQAWPLVSSSARRCRLFRFPYGIVYRIREEEIDIVAFMHLSRKPNYWSLRT